METPTSEKPSLTLRRTYPVAAQRIWQAWTDPQTLSQWFGPGEAGSVTRADIDLRTGGRYHITFFTPDGEDHDVSGTYLEVVQDQKLVFTWAWKSTPERVSQVTITLNAVSGGTELVFHHAQFYDQAARDGHSVGWGATFQKLDALFA